MASAAVTDNSALAIHLTESTVWGCHAGVHFDCPAAVFADSFGLRFGDRAFAAGIADPESFEPYPIRYVDDEYLSLGDRVFPMDEVLAGMLGHLVAGLGVRTAPDLVVLTHPAHWGRGRRRALVKAGRGIGKGVLLIGVPEALARWSPEPMPTGSAVLEVGFLETTASVPGAESDDCVHRAELGSSDLRDNPDVAGEFAAAMRELCPERPPRILVTGELPGTAGLSIVDAIEAGWDLPVVARVVSGSAVAAGALARGLDMVAQTPAAPETIAPVVRRSRWATVGRWGPLVAAGVLVVAAITAVVVVAGGGDPRASAEPDTEVQAQSSARAGRVSVTVPLGWRERADRGDAARVELVPEKGAAARILVVAQELTPGADLEAVAHTLSRRAEMRPETFSAIERGAVDGRPGLLYRERPDPDTEVRWSVLVEDGLQVSVGCQTSPDRWRDLADPCEQAVRSTVIAGR